MSVQTLRPESRHSKLRFADRGPADGASFGEDDASVTTAATANANATASITHADLFAAVEESVLSTRPLVDFFHPTRSGGEDNGDNLTRNQRREAICAVVRSAKFNKARARRLFAGLSPLLAKVAEEETYLPDEDDEGNVIQDSEAESARSIQFLRCCAVLVEAYLDGMLARQGKKSRGAVQKKIEVIDEAFEVAETLHDLLFPLQEPLNRGVKEAQHAQSAIFSVCERWWHGNFEDREQMVTQLIPLLLVRSLDENAQKNDVKRLCSIREALDLLDFEDESIQSLKIHLLRTVGNPLFLQNSEGRKFITHLFLVDASLTTDVHRAVRAQIAGAKKSILNAYADVYFNAWKASSEMSEDGDEDGEIQTSIEENALQDFMYHVIHGAKPSTVKSVRTVLDRFYVNKKSPAVEGMLYRMFSPLLWRALSAANSRVRVQAATALADTFPLRDPEAGEERTEEVVKRSVEALGSLMKDDCASVRVAGINATARVLGSFWAAVPSKDIHLLMNHIVARHASDTKSAAGRAAAINAITTLLEEDKTHAVLRPLLPSLGNLIHDKTEKVRLAVVNMLLLVKRVKGMKYYHVVDSLNLLSRLADEGRGNNNPRGPVARGLSDLLGNSFFPTGKKKTMADIVNRTLRLLSDNPGAAVTFYKNASSQLSVGSICRLLVAQMKCLCAFVMEEKRTNSEDVSNLSVVVPEDESIEIKSGTASNTAIMANIAESISILWESIEDRLKDPENEPAQEMLMEIFAGNVLTDVYCHFESKLDDDSLEDEKYDECSRACAAILNCAGKVDESKIEGLRNHIVGELSKASDKAAEERTKANLSPNIALLCAWGMTEDVAQCLASSIRLYFGGDNDELNASFARKSGTSRKRKTRSGGKKPDVPEKLPNLDIDVCLDALGHLLKGSNPASVTARESLLKSETAFDAISSALQTAQTAVERIMKPSFHDPDAKMSSARAKHMVLAIECRGRLLIHKEHMNGGLPMDLGAELKSLLSWVADTIVPSLIQLVGKDNALRDLDLSSIMSVGSPIASPGPDGPSSRKISRKSSLGGLGDASFISGRGSLNVVDKAAFTSTRAAAIEATASIVYIFADWLAIRFVGESFVSGHLLTLCKILNCSDEAVRKAMLPLLLNVALVCLENDGDSAMLQEVLLTMKNVNPSPAEEQTISHCAAAVLSNDARVVKAAMKQVIHVTRTAVADAEEDQDGSALDVPFMDKVGGMKVILGRVLSEKKGSLLLAECLIDEPKASLLRESLFQELDNISPKSNGLNKILQKWAAESPKKDETALADDEDKENTTSNIHAEPVMAA